MSTCGHELALYNVHKRATLDRLTNKFLLKSKLALKFNAEKNLHSLLDHLDDGASTFHPNIEGLDRKLLTLFTEHKDDVVHVAVSDGIQEVSPDQKLGLWADFPMGMPIELTLTERTRRKRRTAIEQVADRWAHRHKKQVTVLADALLEDYLTAVRKSYRVLSSDWMEGMKKRGGKDESSIRVVQQLLGSALQVSAYSAERIFRTETTNYFNESRHTYFADNTMVDFMELYAVTDGRISEICADRHQAVITISEAAFKKYMPAFHPHCRTIQRPLISSLPSHKKIIDFGESYRQRTESSWTPVVF